MAGVEAIAIVQLIDACIGIARTIISIGLAIKDSQGLPPKLRELCEKLPIIEELLNSAQDGFRKGKISEETSKGVRPIFKQCEKALTELQDVFKKACPEGDDRNKRIWIGAKTVFLGRDSKVHKLLIGIQDNLKLLEQKSIFRIGDRLDELQQVTEALAQEGDSKFTHTGSGNIFTNQGGSHTNYVMSGNGRQINHPAVYNEAPSST